jgi:hypothetical protein
VGAEIGRAAQIGTALPVPLTSFVGRERETEEIAALLQGHRLLTLTGPAGAGKTRLALHVAASVAERFPDEARLAELAAVASAALVAVLGWATAASDVTSDQEVSAVLRSWEQRFDAQVVALTNGIYVSVTAPPRTREHAEHPALEHLLLCSENVRNQAD